MTQDYKLLDTSYAATLFPKRAKDSNKGSFGKLTMLTGSPKYRGAAHLALSAALRSGCGIVRFIGASDLCAELRAVYPEAIYFNEEELTRAELLALSASSESTLIGCGCDISPRLCDLTADLIATSGGVLTLDADALNSIARHGSADLLRTAARPLILTPHPLEFSRISGLSVEEISADRLGTAAAFAAEYGVNLLLKGNGTVITNGSSTLLCTVGNCALAKGGSGDVLAGVISALAAHIHGPLSAAALGAYLHGRAGDLLSEQLSTLGVTPSDLPVAIARQMRTLELISSGNNGKS